MKSIVFTEFAKRHFNKNFAGTKITSHSTEDFLKLYKDIGDIEKNEYKYGQFVHNNLVYYKRQGDFEFSRLITILNYTNAKVATYPITLETLPYLRTDYSSRTQKELPVLSRWFDFPPQFEIPKAKYLTLVLYSKEQIEKETPGLILEADWGIVAILAHDNEEPEPMSPITIMRNALGIKYGGNGQPIDEIKYEKSVEFWKFNANIK